MALAATIVFEVRTGGADTNGGGFKTGATGTDWTLQNAAQYSVTDGVTAGTTSIVSATANFGTDVVGNLIYVTGGTGSIAAAWYEIIARTNSTTITVDRSTGLTAGTGVTLIIGGALASLGQAAAIATVSGHVVYQKNGTYTITSASTNVAGGCTAASAGVSFIGYSATRTITNTGTHPLNEFTAGLSTASFWTSGSQHYVHNIDLDGTGQTTSKGATGAGCSLDNCKLSNFTAGAVTNGVTNGHITFCEFTGCSAVAACGGGSSVFGCVSHGNTIAGFSLTSSISHCLSYGNSGASSDGFIQVANVGISNCVAYNNGRDGFRLNAGVSKNVINCIAEGNAGFGYLYQNAFANLTNAAACTSGPVNTSGRLSGTPQTDSGTTTYSGTAFTNAGAGDFSLNNTAGAGAVLLAAGYPGVFPGGTTTGYLDIGAVQHANPAGGTVVGVIGS